MTKQERTHNTPKKFLQKYKSLEELAEKKRWEAAEHRTSRGSCRGGGRLLPGKPPPGAAWLARGRGIWLVM